jgi:hypothetical protein
MKRAPDPSDPNASPSGRVAGGHRTSRTSIVLAVAAIAYAVAMAVNKAWLCDDAFISFRYAENFANGLGLVYNAGERVEGYSNFLWTLWTAAGMRLGLRPETWSVGWSVFFFAATVAVLWLEHRRRAHVAGARASLAPLAALLAAAHPDWQAYATSGLETSMFTFLATLGYALVVRGEWGPRGAAGAGLAFGLAALTRPDGPIFAAVAMVWVLWARRPRLASLAAIGAGFLIAWLPWMIWRIAYYGDVFPNTYYAKSAHLAWWSQGWIYARLYFERYWVLALAIPLATLALVRARGRSRETAGPIGARASAAHELGLALGMGLAYTVYVMRVGGDFMYARLLIPAAPFLMIALERALELSLGRRASWQWAASVGAVAAVALTPSPLHHAEIDHGVVDEHLVYTRDVVARAQREGLTLRRYFEGLPVRVAIVGSQAALAYYARPAVAIEGGAGLTDHWIARQPLARRGRVGHEKIAPVSYLLLRKTHFTIRYFSGVTLGLNKALPIVTIRFDTIPGRIVHWDPVMLGELRKRGARFSDLPSEIDRFAAGLDRLTDDRAREAYGRLRNFYFRHVRDPARERPFLERIERAKGGP